MAGITTRWTGRGRPTRSVATAIFAAWLTMAFLGRWRIGSDWREWLGLGLGLAWFLALLWIVILEPLAQL